MLKHILKQEFMKMGVIVRLSNGQLKHGRHPSRLQLNKVSEKDDKDSK